MHIHRHNNKIFSIFFIEERNDSPVMTIVPCSKQIRMPQLWGPNSQAGKLRPRVYSVAPLMSLRCSELTEASAGLPG